jgi:hypothetical protein
MDGGPIGYYLMIGVVVFSIIILVVDNNRHKQ